MHDRSDDLVYEDLAYYDVMERILMRDELWSRMHR